ncbi:two-component system, response regulator RegA [Allopseudospirillum japonicum]|uniref:Two-component system, response regulator RegA n=2 Tax=Allopseudospirillum japonicum TaxID=64971 RepID=A0A1H6RI10_9GAMM|nr:response regulator transcription factor [Allopseudospirillum japonicum]SEI55449.1 two-component system, response regulator RegA [Allopseudospirillum japonicum]
MPSERFLVVDDDDVFRGVLKRALSKRGYQVLDAPDVETALALAQQCQEHHEEILWASIDLKMQQASGLTLIEPLLALHPQCRMVMLTGYSSIATAVEAIKLGAVNYLCKPADTQEILAALAHPEANPETEVAEQPPSVNRLTWEHIQKVLQEHEGNISATARALGMHRRTLQRKLQKRPVRQ